MKKNYLFLIVAIIVVLLGIYTINYTKEYKVVEATENKITGTTFALMYETYEGSGVYEQSTDSTWPTNRRYIPELSYCENGSTLIWDNINKTITLHGRLTDKCYVYFAAEPSDVGLRITYAGNSTNLPQSNTTKSVTCNGSSVAWNNQIRGIKLDITGESNLNCKITFTDNQTTDYLNNYIMHLCNSTGTMATCSASTASNQGTGELVYENGIRYEGKDPNNYVWFNNELWRIIGVFDSSSHGRSGENLVKLIRADSIGSYAWNGVGGSPNDWPNSTLYRMLNGCYLYQKKGNETINLTGQSGLCSTYAVGYYYSSGSSAFPGYSDFSKMGIESGYRSMIVEATWYLGGRGNGENRTLYPDNVYSYERDANAIYDGRSASTTGKIGLMYLSDYSYSVLGSSCTRGSYQVNSYGNTSCGPQSWLYGSSAYEWTISPTAGSDKIVWDIYFYGNALTDNASYSYGIRPVLYLSTDVYHISGDGSIDNPYIIGMATS